MSILSAFIPLALSGAGLTAQAAPPAPVAPLAAPAPIVAQPTMTPVKVTPAIARPGDARLIKIQSPSPSPVPAMDRNTIIDRVGKAMTEVKTVQGRFTQVDPTGSPSSGAFYINRPGKVRFEYTSPEPIFIVSDGTTVSIEEPKRKAYDAVPLSSTPLHLFLRSNIDLKKDGSVADVQTSNGSYFVTLVDKTGEAEGKMILQFRTSDFELLGWRQLDGTGAETRVQLSDIKKNVTMKPSLFVVKDPNDDDRRN